MNLEDVRKPGQCDWCFRHAPRLTPVEGENLCWPCTNAYLDEAAKEAKVRFGDSEMAHPRAWKYR